MKQSASQSVRPAGTFARTGVRHTRSFIARIEKAAPEKDSRDPVASVEQMGRLVERLEGGLRRPSN